MIEIMGGDEKPQVTLPKECLDPKGIKMGDDISHEIKGKVVGISKHGVTIEIGDYDDEDSDEDMDYDASEEDSDKLSKKLKIKMSKKLEEYQ